MRDYWPMRSIVTLLVTMGIVLTVLVGVAVFATGQANNFRNHCTELGGTVKTVSSAYLCVSPDGRLLDSE